MLTPGDPAPDFELLDQNENAVKLSELRGRKVLVLLSEGRHPRVHGAGVRTQRGARRRRRHGGARPARTSRRSRPSSREVRPRLPAAVRSEHAVAESFDVWKEKSMYGRKYMGIERSAFLVDERGRIAECGYKVSPADTPKNLLAALAARAKRANQPRPAGGHPAAPPTVPVRRRGDDARPGELARPERGR